MSIRCGRSIRDGLINAGFAFANPKDSAPARLNYSLYPAMLPAAMAFYGLRLHFPLIIRSLWWLTPPAIGARLLALRSRVLIRAIQLPSQPQFLAWTAGTAATVRNRSVPRACSCLRRSRPNRAHGRRTAPPHGLCRGLQRGTRCRRAVHADPRSRQVTVAVRAAVHRVMTSMRTGSIMGAALPGSSSRIDDPRGTAPDGVHSG
jgi:hypothetical protein